MRLRNTYFILRHGQTIYQTKKRQRSYPLPQKNSVKLIKKGQSQIKKAGRALKKEKIDIIYSSDFLRTRQTAKIIAKKLAKKIIFDKRLRDINLGVYRGKSRARFRRDFPLSASKKRFAKRPKGGESWEDVRKRMAEFLKEIDEKQRNKTILIVSHGDPLWLLEGVVRGWSGKKLIYEKLAGRYIKTGGLRKL